MTTPLPLRDYQFKIAEFELRHPRCLVLSPMGSGKTLSTLAFLELSALFDGGHLPALVLAPRFVAQTVWPSEVRDWPFLRHLRVSVMLGTPAERKAALRKDADIYCINYENIGWLVEQKYWPFKAIIADEVSKLKGFRTRQGSVRARALSHVAFKSERFVGLTGTVVSNNLPDLWGPMWFIDQGARLGKTFSAYQQRWFSTQRDEAIVRLTPFPHSMGEITSRVSDVCLSLDMRDYFDIAQPITNTIHVDLPPRAAAIYKRMAKDLLAELESMTTVEAVSAGDKSNKLRQLASGIAITDRGGAWEEVHTEKLDALASVIEEANGAPVLVAYYYKANLGRILKRFPEAREIKGQAAIDAWNAGRIPVGVIHPKSAGHGLNLQHGGNILCFFELDWNMEERLQVMERIGPLRQLQSGYDRPVYHHHIIARGTLDSVVLERVDEKKSVLETLLAALRG